MLSMRNFLTALPCVLGPVAVAMFLNSQPLPVEHAATTAAPPCQGMVLEERGQCLKKIEALKDNALGTGAAIAVFTAATM